MAGEEFDMRLYEAPLTEGEKALRDLFVNEYMKDFDPFHAAVRCGFLATFAMEWGKKLLMESYVQKQISHLTRSANVDTADELAADKALIVNALRQAIQHGPYASRVSAAAKLAEIRGIAKPDAGADAEQGLIDVLKGFAQVAPV